MLSVIIVNYNVKYFLEQALLSAQKAAQGLAVEIIVVDNNSVDGSVDMVRQKFPNVILIANKKNTGFSTANNQGIRIAKGKYVLLLNPDTVVEEDTFKHIIDFMEEHPDAGGLGVKMYDGKGVFLPESKRGLPTPWVAFYKIFGFSGLFPKSKHFNWYYLGHLDDDEVHEIEVLSGAFMMMRKSVLDKIGLLDETFFMYGEDIDLSYRITQAGYKNYYYPHTRIIHYKGESTKKGSLNYVRVFYNAMIIFAQKHFSSEQAQLYTLAIRLAIYLRAFIAIVSRSLKKAFLPFVDATFIYTGLFFIKNFWQNNIKAAEHIVYSPEYMLINVPLYILIWLSSIFFSGGYDRPLQISKGVRGVLLGTLFIAAVYGFLPETLRFSRAMIVLGAAWATFIVGAIRVASHFIQHKHFRFEEKAKSRAIIVGNKEESKRVQNLLLQAGVDLDMIGYVATHQTNEWPKKGNNNKSDQRHLLGTLEQLTEVVNIYKIEEIIFCGQDISSQQIIQFMIDIGQSVDYKIVPKESMTIIGSNSKNTAGDLYTIAVNLNINQAKYQRNKRVLDAMVCLLFFFSAPLLLLVVNKKWQFVKNWFKVLLGQYSWVGYAHTDLTEQGKVLPKIKPGILSPLDALPTKAYSKQTIYRLNVLYAKDYTTDTDLGILWKGFFKRRTEDGERRTVNGERRTVNGERRTVNGER